MAAAGSLPEPTFAGDLTEDIADSPLMGPGPHMSESSMNPGVQPIGKKDQYLLEKMNQNSVIHALQKKDEILEKRLHDLEYQLEQQRHANENQMSQNDTKEQISREDDFEANQETQGPPESQEVRFSKRRHKKMLRHGKNFKFIQHTKNRMPLKMHYKSKLKNMSLLTSGKHIKDDGDDRYFTNDHQETRNILHKLVSKK